MTIYWTAGKMPKLVMPPLPCKVCIPVFEKHLEAPVFDSDKDCLNAWLIAAPFALAPLAQAAWDNIWKLFQCNFDKECRARAPCEAKFAFIQVGSGPARIAGPGGIVVQGFQLGMIFCREIKCMPEGEGKEDVPPKLPQYDPKKPRGTPEPAPKPPPDAPKPDIPPPGDLPAWWDWPANGLLVVPAPAEDASVRRKSRKR